MGVLFDVHLCRRPSAALRAAARGVALAGACLALAASVHAGDAAAGKVKAQACIQCHGDLGISRVPDAPNLAGQPEIYVATQLRAYRSGARQHEIMSLMAKPLSDDDIDNLAAWFSSIRIDAQAPR